MLTFTAIDENILEFDKFCKNIHGARIDLLKKQILKNDQTHILILLILETIKKQNTHNEFDSKFLNSIDVHKLSKSIDEYYYYQYNQKEIIPNTKIERLFLEVIKELDTYLKIKNTILKVNSLNYSTEETVKNWDHKGDSCIFIILPQTEIHYVKHLIDNLVKYKNAYIFIRGFDKSSGIKNLYQKHIYDFLNRNKIPIDSVHDISKLKPIDYFIPSIILNNIDEKFDQNLLTNVNILRGKNLNEEAKMIALVIREKLKMGKNNIIIQTKSYELAKKIENSLKFWNINTENLVSNAPNKSTYSHFFLLISLYLNTKKNDYLLLLDILKSNYCKIDNKLINNFELKFLRKLFYRDKISDYLIDLNNSEKNEFNTLQEIEGKFLEKKILLKNSALTIQEYFKIHLELFYFLKNDSDNTEFDELLSLIEQKLEVFKNENSLNFDQYIKIIDKLLTSNEKSNNFKNSKSVIMLQTFETRNIQYDTIFFAGLNEGIFPDSNFDQNYFSAGFRQINNLKSIDSEMQFMEYDFISSFFNNDLILSCSESTNTKNQICRWLEKLLAIKNLNEKSIIFTEKYRKLLQNIYKLPIEKNTDIEYARVDIDQRPKKISVTGVEKLISNPYVYYAKYILKVSPLEKIAREAEKKEFGILLHDLIPKALSEKHKNLEEFNNYFSTKFNEYIKYKYVPYKISKFWYLRLGNIANAIHKNFYYEGEFNYFNEKAGSFNLLFKSRNIELFCIADRIEILQQENIAKIIDFKSGYIPNANEVAKGLYPQLPIEKYIFINNGFDININNISNADLEYFDISGKLENVEKQVVSTDLIETEKGLKLLIEKFLCNETDFFIKNKVNNKRNKSYFHILRIT
ncbi:MAG: PD-(D/E)XK nuclease family protein [Candidatus Midichloriaceae bacterium]